jgi:diguanylate cyclase (GGDEF)-like protein
MESTQIAATGLKDHEVFGPSLEELDCHLAKSFRGNVIGIIAIMVAIVAVLILEKTSNVDPIPASAIEALLLLMFVLHVYTFSTNRAIKGVRDRIAKQMVVAVKHRLRADQLYDLSILDPLTGLHNRRFGDQRLKQEVVRTERNNEALAVVLLDLDGFKEINDQHGHAAGDLALREFSRCLRRAVRACDVPVRIGGDEFMVILPDCARENVDSVLSRLGAPTIEVNDVTIAIGYSAGRAHYQIGDTAESLRERADKVLYEEKAARKQPRKAECSSSEIVVVPLTEMSNEPATYYA